MASSSRDRLVSLTLALSGLGFAALAAAIVLWDAADQLDVEFVTWVHRTAPDALVDGMRVVTYAGSAVLLGPLAIAATLILVRRGRRGAAAYVLAAFVTGQLLSQTVKFVFQRARPQLDEPYVHLSTYAFPSGHALGATATYGALLVVLWTIATRQRVLFSSLIVSLVIAIAVSRVVLGAHYVLDVVAGVLGGIAVLSGLFVAFESAPRRSSRLRLFRRDEQPQAPRLDP